MNKMKRVQQSTNTNTNTEISRESVNGTGKRKRAKENNESSVSDAHELHSSTSGSMPMSRSSDVDGERLQMSISDHDNGDGYNLRSKNPPLSLSSDSDSDGDDDDVVISNLRSNRLQQPPAYINTNLMKVKMECDYVPILAPKEEPADDTAIQDESESGAECPINCIPTSGLTSQESEIEQQEKLRVKVEFDAAADASVSDSLCEISVTGNKTETSNEELHRTEIGNLEEKIKEYAQQVISLSRDKTEIQTTLQTEITELNLVIEQLKTENEDLSSTVAHQRDENNRINAQNNLKQEKIEKLKKKLKSLAKNQQTAENSNSNIEPNPVPVPAPVKTGILPTNVLSHVFEYLDIKSVKESRLVCRQWRNEAGKILLQNFYLVSDEKGRCEKSLINLLTNSHAIPNSASTSMSKSTAATSSIKLWSKDKHSKFTLQLLTKFPKLRWSIRELKFSTSSERPDTEILYEILNVLPNLQVLETCTLDLSRGQKWLRDFNVAFCRSGKRNSRGIPLKLELFIQKLETLEKLKLDFGMGEETAGNFLRNHQRFASMKSIELRTAGRYFMNGFKTNTARENLRITRFTLDIHENYKDNVELTRWFLLRIAPALQHLKFVVKPEDSTSVLVSPSMRCFEPWDNDWMITLELQKLETLEIKHKYSPGGNVFVVKSILAALRLPRLLKLTLNFIPVELEGIIHQWNSHESAIAKGRTLKSESLKELEILPGFEKPSKSWTLGKIPANPWPRLKSLKCWSHPDSFDVSILTELSNLQRLELNISSDWSWNSYENRKQETSCNKNSDSKFQLQDLKHLTSFCLKVPWNDQRYQDFAQDLVDKDLKFMTSLTFVQFDRVVIDVKALKSALGPNLTIIFTD